MPSTLTLQNTINWSQCFVDFESLNIGSGNEPAITNANTILQTIIGPPFKWNWNRNAFGLTFITVFEQQDYTMAVADFGFLEGASAALSGTAFAIKDIQQELTVGTETGRPQSMAAFVDDNTGNITFRLLPVPDNLYTIVPYYQKRIPGLFTALSGTWAPIPDHFSYLYNYGFLALALAYANDQRFPTFNQKFVAHLLGTQQGLSETERNMFLERWNMITRQEQLVTMKSQQGRAALGT